MEMDGGTNLKLVRRSRGQVVDLDLPRVWRIHWQLDPVGHTRVLLPIPEETGVETTIYRLICFIFMPHSRVSFRPF